MKELTKKKRIDVDILPENARTELIDFYEFLVRKYVQKELKTQDIPNKKEHFFKSVKKYSYKLPRDYVFNREELYER